jgi:beta-lactam-binding protein with PASTA domain
MVAKIVKVAALAAVFALVAAVSAYFTLSLVVKSEDTVVVPDLMTRDVVYALEQLTDLGLNTKVSGSDYSDTVAKNHIIYQDPEPGTEIKKGRDVKIRLSRGSEMIRVPNLTGLALRQAQIIFEENGLCKGTVAEVHHPTLEKEVVIAQFPMTGREIRRGQCVDLLISLGPRAKAYKMPDLTGRPMDAALLAIEKEHLIVGEVRYSFVGDQPLRRVVQQEPPAGYRVTEHRPVDLVVNRKPIPAGDRQSAPATGSFFHYRVDNGILKRHIRVEYTRDDIEADLFDDFVKPGDDIWLILPPEGGATVRLYEDDRLVLTRMYQGW